MEDIVELRNRLVHTGQGLEGLWIDASVFEGIEKNLMLVNKQLGETLEPYRKQLDQIAKKWADGFK